ncbi:bifunctional adenosylcobinamide kinase/adenosylcobinamide-phosphate guanylyltransferase [Blautia sp. MSJ-19]|uniref:bifunctional adenosylcobinamide kinase/adenosylcobinamide-phosphate guanylyltransferase n=1 Tax=Blautia sp. MSJ-19 TaxID=2841517 RepID=UPI001C0EAF53|nr:bifunctional adenosylcobinamide kinase/adenosylcobinamide-phosphate guanylyltransferase [Blautia sp. MSJ-19]MBU5482345.1 bifunctional adenosylcobinamide kinase/adenosylcobinamide-phosphate guanylyltransferase [Blautia sp. MSJ-19]
MMILVTGGSGSGKSAFAEDCVVSFGGEERVYIATMYPFDEESKKRVQRHRKMRQGKGFKTIECYTRLERVQVPEDSTVLLECMSNLVANEMFQEDGAHEDTVASVLRGVRQLKEQTGNLVIVTNEIFSEAATYQGDTERYQEYLGKINQELAEMAEQVVEVVYGIPIYHKECAPEGQEGSGDDEKPVEQL